MPLAQDLLSLARELVDRKPAAPVEADLRRAVSTGYYALFHLLVEEATAQLVSVVAVRSRVARAFDHRIMRLVCQDYSQMSPNPAGLLLSGTGEVVPPQLKNIATEFVELQRARHQADYDTGVTIAQTKASTDVMCAEIAFIDWAAVRTHPPAATFLAELLCRGIPRR